MKKKPQAPIIGADGNIFNVMGIAGKSLRSAGMRDEAKEMAEKVMSSRSYEEALAVICDYIEPVSIEQTPEMNM